MAGLAGAFWKMGSSLLLVAEIDGNRAMGSCFRGWRRKRRVAHDFSTRLSLNCTKTGPIPLLARATKLSHIQGGLNSKITAVVGSHGRAVTLSLHLGPCSDIRQQQPGSPVT